MANPKPGTIARLDTGHLRVIMSEPIPTHKPCGCLTDSDRYIVDTSRLKPLVVPERGTAVLAMSMYDDEGSLESVYEAFDPNANPIAVLSIHPCHSSNDSIVTLGWFVGSMPHRKVLRSDTKCVPQIFKDLTPDLLPDNEWAREGFRLLREHYAAPVHEYTPDDLQPGLPVWFVDKAAQFWTNNQNGRWRIVQEIADQDLGDKTRPIVIFTDGGKRLLKEMPSHWTCFDAYPETPGYPEERR